CPCRRSDRIEMRFAAAHESGDGPKAAVAECLLSRRCWGLSRRTPELPLAAATPFSPPISDPLRPYIRPATPHWFIAPALTARGTGLRGLDMSPEATLQIPKLHRPAAGAPARPGRLGRSQDRALPLDGLQTAWPRPASTWPSAKDRPRSAVRP